METHVVRCGGSVNVVIRGSSGTRGSEIVVAVVVDAAGMHKKFVVLFL